MGRGTVSHRAGVGAVPVPNSRRFCHLVAGAWWRFDPSHPEQVAWTLLAAFGGQGV